MSPDETAAAFTGFTGFTRLRLLLFPFSHSKGFQEKTDKGLSRETSESRCQSEGAAA